MRKAREDNQVTAHQWTYITAALFMLVVIVELLRRGKLREKYAVVWGVTSLVFLVFAFAPSIPTRVSNFLGFELPSNFVLALVNFLLLGMLLQLGLAVGRLEDQNQSLGEHIALLNARLDSTNLDRPDSD
ncbi:MAG: DUF2304 family protein [Actinobacteria bacterium]|nr:DUF2304 family protein [Actinomycetota bacterium]